jgi:hypothetical protein
MAILNEYGQPYTFAHAADRSMRRGPQFSVRNDDIDRLIPSTDRRTLASLSHRLFMNMGVPRACILQKADYAVGEAWLPQYDGIDRDAALPVCRFMESFWFPQCDVRGGIYDWWMLLELASVAMDRDGDLFWILVKGDDGMPRIQVIPSHRCYSRDSSGKVTEAGPWKGYRINDGVIYYASGRPAAYRFNISTDNTEKFKDIPASDIIHIFDPTHAEQGRGLPAFTHALESLKMSLLSTEDERIRQQIVSRLQLTVFNESGGPDIDDPMTILGNATNGTSGITSQSFPGGVLYLPENGNSRIEQMKHENPGDVWESFQNRLIRDAVIPIWSISVWSGSTQGTDVRAEVVKCRRFVTKRQGRLWYAAKRAFSWAYSVFAEQGKVPVLKSPFAWDFSRPPRLSVDDGRESKMELEELRTGSRNLSEVLAARGLEEETFLRSRAASVWRRKFTAKSVAKELNAKYGQDIEIEEREMFMLTPNEMSEVEPKETPEPIKPNEPNSD